MKHKNIITTCLAITLCMSLFSHNKAFATKIDIEQEISIKSDKQSADLKTKTLEYLNNVVITQGTLTIEADIVQIFRVQDTENKNSRDTYLAKGNPAVFQQTLEDGSIITLEADKITYQPELFLVNISGNAKVKQASSEVTGSEITYNISTERLNAVSNSNEQVTTILQPSALKNKKDDIDAKNKDKDNTDTKKPDNNNADSQPKSEEIKQDNLTQERG